ncbi:CDP-alcohol phosphatidyltransferase family protein [candidate division WOR-3 bacterium]|nr:CDP-alcohol phosphatidyltransferase family protein [candidate division WOR-3 bacterium]
MFSENIKKLFRRSLHPLIMLFVMLKITPNMLTVAGLLINIYVAYLIATGNFILGGIILIVASLFDTFDGELARTTGKITKVGAFLDSIADRYAEFFILGGVAYYFISNDLNIGIIAAFFSLVGAIMTSYTRARAEGIGIELKKGFFQRPERMIFLMITFLFLPRYLVYAMMIFAFATVITALQRTIIGMNSIKMIK